MVEQVEMLADIRDYDEAKTAIENGAEEIIPSEVVNTLMEGGNPVRIWREHRQMTQQELSEAAGISTPFLSQIETGKRAGSVKVLTKIAGTLNVAIEDLLI
jgi:DNA-binding XRE family transcriptional regulator